MNQARIVLDESGTPGNGITPFVTAGIAIYGDWKKIESQWSSLVRIEKFPPKGRKYTESHFLAVVDFLISNQIFPVVSSHQLSAEVAGKLAKRTTNFSSHRTPEGLQNITHAHYVWMHHLLSTVAHCLMPITQHLGPVQRLDVIVDKFTLTDEIRDFIVKQFALYFSQGGLFQRQIQSQSARFSKIPVLNSVCAKTFSEFQIAEDGLHFDMNSKGPLNTMADAVAALARRNMLSDSAAAIPWQLLCMAWETRSIIEMDLTKYFTTLSNTGWDEFTPTLSPTNNDRQRR